MSAWYLEKSYKDIIFAFKMSLLFPKYSTVFFAVELLL